MSKQTIELAWWRQRRAVLIAGAVLLLILVIGFAGGSAAIVIEKLAVEGVFLLLWLAAAAGYGGALLPLPLRERAGVRGNRVESIGERTPLGSERPPPHPNPLPQGERGPDKILRAVSVIAIGLGLLSLIQLGLGLAGLIHSWTAFGVIAVGIALLAFRCRRMRWGDIVAWFTAPADWDWLWLVALPPLAMALVAALLPPGLLWTPDEPHGYDVLEYHLQLPREFYQLHGIAPLRHNVFSFFPQGMEMQYMLAMQLRHGAWTGMYLAQLMNVVTAALAVVAIYAAARQFAPKLPSILAAIAAAYVPWTWLLAPIAYNEPALLLFATLAIAWVFRDDRRAWVVAGVMAGFACGVKLTGVPQVLLLMPVIAATVAVPQRKRIGPVLADVAVFILAGVIVFSPWLIRNQIWAGNPVFPEAQTLLGRAHFTEAQTRRWQQAHSPTPEQRPIGARLAAARDQLVKDWRFGFVLLPLALVCAAVAIRRPQAWLLVALIFAWLVFWLSLTHLQNRFFVIALPAAALCIALMESRRQLLFAAFAVLIEVVLGLTMLTSTYVERVQPWLGAVGITDFDRAHDEAEVQDVLLSDQPLALVGDAKALLYPTPDLRYRTVFDVDVKPGQSVVEAWLGDQSGSPYILIDPRELERFADTYYGIPHLPPDFPYPRDRRTIIQPAARAPH